MSKLSIIKATKLKVNGTKHKNIGVANFFLSDMGLQDLITTNLGYGVTLTKAPKESVFGLVFDAKSS